QIVEREAINHHGLIHIRYSHRHLLPPFRPSLPCLWSEACSGTSAVLDLLPTAGVRSAVASVLRLPAAACSGNRQTPALPVPVPRVLMSARGLQLPVRQIGRMKISSTGHTITHAPQLMPLRLRVQGESSR